MTQNPLSSPGRRIRWLRDARDLTQTELGRRAGCSQPSISQYENDRFTPDRSTRARIAKALDSHVDFIWQPADLARPSAAA